MLYPVLARPFLLLTALLFGCAAANAVTLDWDTATWTSGATTGSPATGIDMDITASATGLFQGSLVNTSIPTPTISRAFDGGLTTGEKALELAIDLPNKGNAEFVTVTITFNAAVYANGVYDVSFSLFDIDYANDSSISSTYQDRVFNISATTTSGGTLNPTISNLGSSVTNNSGVLTGNASTVDTGPGSGDGNATISFTGSPIRSITFSYGSGGLFMNPTYQHVGLYDVTFTPVPEMNPAWFGAFSCIAATFLVLRHNARFRK